MSKAPELRSMVILLILFGQISYRNRQKRNNRMERIITYILKMVYFVILFPSIFMLLGLHKKHSSFHKFTAFSRDISYIFYVGSNLIALFTDLLRPSRPYLLYKQINSIIAYTNYRINAIDTQQIKRKFFKRLWIGVLPIVGNLILKSAWRSLFTPPLSQAFITAAQIYRHIALLYSVLIMDATNSVLSAMITHLEKLPNDRKHYNQIYATIRQMKWIHFKLFRVSELYNKW